MEITEEIDQLEDLKAHCESMADADSDVWSKDVQALELAIEALKAKVPSSGN